MRRSSPYGRGCLKLTAEPSLWMSKSSGVDPRQAQGCPESSYTREEGDESLRETVGIDALGPAATGTGTQLNVSRSSSSLTVSSWKA
jgi:hypothetical protein